MQHKRKSPSKGILLSLVLACIIGGGLFLMMSPIPAPQQPIEKELDATALLESRQP